MSIRLPPQLHGYFFCVRRESFSRAYITYGESKIFNSLRRITHHAFIVTCNEANKKSFQINAHEFRSVTHWQEKKLHMTNQDKNNIGTELAHVDDMMKQWPKSELLLFLGFPKSVRNGLCRWYWESAFCRRHGAV